MIPKCIGGVSDHVHLLVTLPTRVAVQLIKAGSSAWIHQTFPNLRNFAQLLNRAMAHSALVSRQNDLGVTSQHSTI
jgi:REP element-mobilizing transposase RayT